MCACVRACVGVCVCVCVRACVRGGGGVCGGVVVFVVFLLNHCMEYYVQNILVWMEWGSRGQGVREVGRNSSLSLAEVKQLPNCPILQTVEDFEPFIL